MNAEREIVELWLNKLGFFTVKNINAGKTVISLIAIKTKDKSLERVAHIEVACSISNNLLMQDYIRKFEDKHVENKVKSVLKKFVGKEINYEKILVTTTKRKFKGIQTIDFHDVLKSVIRNLDKQKYNDTTIRTLQLLKYIYLKRNKSYKDIPNSKKKEIFISSLGDKRFQREFMNSIYAEEIVKRYLKRNKAFLIEYLKGLNKKAREDILLRTQKEKPSESEEKFIPLNKFLKQKSI